MRFLDCCRRRYDKDIVDGRIPVKGATGTPEEQLAAVTAKLEEVTAQAQARAEAGQRTNLQGPGVPLPQEGEVGFDLSDEP